MGWTQTQLDALEDAISKGVRTVKYEDKEVEYRSLEDMLKLRDLMRRALGLTGKPSRIYPTTDKGLES